MNHLSFDEYLTSNIGLGKGQLGQFCVLSFVQFMNGFTLSLYTILIQILKNEWNLNQSELIYLGSIYFLGTVIGLYISSFYADVLGRQKLMYISMFFNFLAITTQGFINNYLESLFIRFLFGIVIGISGPLCLILISEQVPISYRGRVATTLQLMYLIGIFYMFLCCSIFLESLDKGNWKLIFKINSIPAFFCFLCVYLFLHDTPRFQLTKQNYSKAFEKLNQIGRLNDRQHQPLTSQQKDGLIRWQEKTTSQQVKRSIPDLFKHGNKYVTINLWIILFFWNLQCASIFLLIPFIIQESGNGLLAMFFTFFFELPATIFVILLIDSKKLGGRKRLMTFGLILFVSVEFIMYKFRAPTVVFGMIMIRVADAIVWLSLLQLTIESYTTFYRSLGVGMAVAVGKLGSIVAGFTAFTLFAIDPYLPFLVLGCLSLITIILVLIHPIDLTQKPLDECISEIFLECQGRKKEIK